MTTDITITDDVTSIGKMAFYGSNIKSITIPNSVTSIGSSAFHSCSDLTNITIPDSVTNIGINTFYNCNGLTVLNYNSQKVFSNIFADFNYNRYTSNLILAILGNNVTSVDTDAFANCSNLKRILIPKSVTEIEKGAFSDCSNLAIVEYGGSQADWNEIYIGAENENLTNANIIYNSSLSNTTLTDLDYLTYTKNDDNTITITDCNTAATNINIPDKIDGLPVTNIAGSYYNGGSYDSAAFYNCSKLTTITIPNSIKSIGDSAFSGCNSLTDVYYTGTATQWESIDIGYSNSTLTDATMHYNGVAPTPVPTPTPTPKPTPKPTPIPITTATVTKSETNTTYNFDVTPEAAYANCYVYAAVYDVNGALLKVNRVPLELTGSTSISVNKSENDALVKVFIWADTLQPIITAEKFPLI